VNEEPGICRPEAQEQDLQAQAVGRVGLEPTTGGL
jgi:hypothetical protein